MKESLLTFELSEDGLEIDIHGDKAGLTSLAEIISKVAQTEQHDHLMTSAWGGYELSDEKQSEKSILVNKVTIHCWPKSDSE